MLCRIIFCTAVSLAILAVILLALLSPIPHTNHHHHKPWLALSLYIQHPHIPSSNVHNPSPPSDAGAFMFHRTLTEGPRNTSRVVGRAQGFIIPVQDFAHSAFNIIYLTFDTPEYSGSLSVQAKNVAHKNKQELTVVGGTGVFAFARGLALFAQTEGQGQPFDGDASYHVKLQLRIPRTVSGNKPKW